LILGISMFGSVATNAAPSAPATKALYSANTQLGQILFPRNRRHRHNRRGNQNGNVRYETVTVNRGRKIYRDTYRITYKNGHEKRKRVEHVRIA
jgi:hypothetical protein